MHIILSVSSKIIRDGDTTIIIIISSSSGYSYLWRDTAQGLCQSVVGQSPLGQVEDADIEPQLASQRHDEGALPAARRTMQQVACPDMGKGVKGSISSRVSATLTSAIGDAAVSIPVAGPDPLFDVGLQPRGNTLVQDDRLDRPLGSRLTELPPFSAPVGVYDGPVVFLQGRQVVCIAQQRLENACATVAPHVGKYYLFPRPARIKVELLFPHSMHEHHAASVHDEVLAGSRHELKADLAVAGSRVLSQLHGLDTQVLIVSSSLGEPAQDPWIRPVFAGDLEGGQVVSSQQLDTHLSGHSQQLRPCCQDSQSEASREHGVGGIE